MEARVTVSPSARKMDGRERSGGCTLDGARACSPALPSPGQRGCASQSPAPQSAAAARRSRCGSPAVRRAVSCSSSDSRCGA
eukprot:5143070-Prymnesium_polylepis.1